MEQVSYSRITELLKEYERQNEGVFTEKQKEMCEEIINRTRDLEIMNKKIAGLMDELLPVPSIKPDGNADVVSLFGFQIRVERADPNVPIGYDNATIVFPRRMATEIELELHRDVESYYATAARICEISKYLPDLQSFDCVSVRKISNSLIKHAGRQKKVTYDTFGYSHAEGPFIKPLRKGTQTEIMDKGFVRNSKDFVTKFEKTLSTVVQK